MIPIWVLSPKSRPDGGNGSYARRIEGYVWDRLRRPLWDTFPRLSTSLAKIEYVQEGSGHSYERRPITNKCKWCGEQIEDSGWGQVSAQYLAHFTDEDFDDEPYDMEVTVYWHRECARKQRDLLAQAIGLEISKEMLGQK